MRQQRFDKKNIFSDKDGHSIFKLPGEEIYKQEKMPFVFLNENYDRKVKLIRN